MTPRRWLDRGQGKQPDGAARALEVMIKKSNIDNFPIYSEPLGAAPVFEGVIAP